jgi:hypothetical protein
MLRSTTFPGVHLYKMARKLKIILMAKSCISPRENDQFKKIRKIISEILLQ